MFCIILHFGCVYTQRTYQKTSTTAAESVRVSSRDDFARPAEAEATCLPKVSNRIVVVRFQKFSIISVKYKRQFL